METAASLLLGVACLGVAARHQAGETLQQQSHHRLEDNIPLFLNELKNG
jgi:hypothetical protein